MCPRRRRVAVVAVVAAVALVAVVRRLRPSKQVVSKDKSAAGQPAALFLCPRVP
jgi:hypothetical protein